MIIAVHVNIVAPRIETEPAVSLREKGIFPKYKKKVLKPTIHHSITMTLPIRGGLNVFTRTAAVMMLAVLRAEHAASGAIYVLLSKRLTGNKD